MTPGLFPAVLVAGIVATAAMVLTIRRAFSALYWWCIGLVVCFPLVSDVLQGLPPRALEDGRTVLLVYAAEGVRPAAWFALAHVLVTIAVYGVCVRRAQPSKRTLAPNRMQRTTGERLRSAKPLFWFLLIASVAVIAIRRGDLTRVYNDFLQEGSAAQYETYTFLAASPLAAILWREGKRARLQLMMACGAALLGAYFLGVRYYTFPFVVYVGWMFALEPRKSKFSRLAFVTGGILCGSIVFGLWGVARRSGMRDQPLAAAAETSAAELTSEMFGMEMPARVCFYDLMGRMAETGGFRGPEAIAIWVESAIYPRVLLLFNRSVPVSNSKRVFELQTGIRDTGVSSGATVFGNDWFAFGWAGAVVGGAIMGALLAGLDHTIWTNGMMAMLVGPLATFQLIFFARGGTDVWLGVWGRVIPIWALVFAVAATREGWLLQRRPQESACEDARERG